MDQERIATLLRPFLQRDPSAAKLGKVSVYIDTLLKWNARINLTSIRGEHEIVTRHFGESFFLAQCLFASKPQCSQDKFQATDLIDGLGGEQVLDIGSGAGFPGLPLKIWADQIRLTLVEANHKKSAFLREVVRAIGLRDVSVISERAETLAENSEFARADIVTLRAVERFSEILPVALTLLAPNGRLALLIGQAQIDLLPHDAEIAWGPSINVPGSNSRVVCIGSKDKSGRK